MQVRKSSARRVFSCHLIIRSKYLRHWRAMVLISDFVLCPRPSCASLYLLKELICEWGCIRRSARLRYVSRRFVHTASKLDARARPSFRTNEDEDALELYHIRKSFSKRTRKTNNRIRPARYFATSYRNKTASMRPGLVKCSMTITCGSGVICPALAMFCCHSPLNQAKSEGPPHWSRPP